MAALIASLIETRRESDWDANPTRAAREMLSRLRRLAHGLRREDTEWYPLVMTNLGQVITNDRGRALPGRDVEPLSGQAGQSCVTWQTAEPNLFPRSGKKKVDETGIARSPRVGRRSELGEGRVWRGASPAPSPDGEQRRGRTASSSSAMARRVVCPGRRSRPHHASPRGASEGPPRGFRRVVLLPAQDSRFEQAEVEAPVDDA